MPPHVSVWGLFFMIKLYLDSGADKRVYCFVRANVGIHRSHIEVDAEWACSIRGI